MKKIRYWAVTAALVPCALLCWMLVHAQAPAIVPPFATTPFISASSPIGGNIGIVLYGKHLNGSYDHITESYNPFNLLAGATALASFLADGLGNLMAAPGGPPNVGRASQMVGGGKFTASGNPGFAYLTYSGSSVFVVSGSPSFSFSATTQYAVGPNPTSLLVADFNGDSVMDIAVTYQGGVGILLNKGDGTFNPIVTYSAGSQPYGLAAWDVNHDNILDLVVTDSSASSVYVLTGNANGIFNAAVPYPVAGSLGNAVTIADFDGDGNPDLAVANGFMSGNVSILLNNGNGTFRSGPILAVGGNPYYVAAGDFNGDSKLDLAVVDHYGQTVTIYLGTGGGNFRKGPSYVTSAIPDSLVLTDFNNDGELDVLVAEGDARLFGANLESGNIDILLGNGDGTFQGASIANNGTSSSGSTALAVADFDGDGVPDAVANNTFQGSLFVLHGAGNGTFQPPSTINLGQGSQPSALASGDFNSDGKTDLAVAEASGTGSVAILLNSSSGLQTPSTFASGGSTPMAIVAADFDGDGKLDLAVANSKSGNTVVFHGAGNGSFQLANTYATGTNPQSIAAQDVNGDGLPDLIVADSGQQFNTPAVPGGLYVLINQGGGNFKPPVLYSTGDFPITVVTGDVNGDGIPDIVATAAGANVSWTVDVLPGVSGGTFGPATSIPTEFGATMPAVLDFNGDGKADIVVAHCCGATDMTYLQGNGNGTFQTEVEFNGGPSPYAVEAADLNHDGSPDIVILGNNGGVVGLLNTTPAVNFPCQLSSTVLQPAASGGNITVTISSGSCALGVTNLPSWITVASTNSSSVTLAIAANTGGARSANISIGTISVAVNQAAPPACTYSLSDRGQAFPPAGGNAAVSISVNSGCPWNATSPPSWITFTNSASSSGAGTLTFQAAANSGAARSGSFTVAGIAFSVQQEAASISGLSLIGSMPHIAAEENWTTMFTMVNNTSSSNQVRFSTFGSNIDASGSGNPLQLPLNLPQQASLGVLLGASLDNTLSPNASWIVSTAGQGIMPVQTGSAQVSATGALGGFAIFHRFSDAQEAVVPLTPGTPRAPSYLLAFDNTGGIVTSVAVANVSSQTANIGYIIRDDTGAQIGSGTLSAIPGTGQISFVLPDGATGFPVTINKRGTVEFDTPASGQISVLGIRDTPQVTANGTITTLTTVPALANVGTGGGSFAFIAAGGDGWQTTFVLVNAGGAAPATLKFFDPNGNPLPLPISYPQVGNALTTVSSINPTLAGGATLVVQSSGTSTLATGSAQLTTSGNVSGFVIFRHNGQEAVVPIESRNANAYVLAFDNTGGTATGLAVNAVSAQAANVPVVIRDDAGNQLATDILPLAANGDFSGDLGQNSPTLGRILFPATANIRGTVEFDAPAGVHIGVMGIRTPATQTYTSLPALAK